MKEQKQFKRYIPLLIKEKLDELNYHRKDDLYVIIDLIYRKEMYYKSDYQDLYGFTEISQKQFKELLPSSDGFNSAIQFLINNDLVKRNDYYIIKGGKPKGYKLPKELLSRTIPVMISEKNINKRIGHQLKLNRKMKEKRLEFAQSKYFKTFRIDFDEAEKAIIKRTCSEIKKLCFNLGLTYTESDILDIIECRKNHLDKRFKIIIHPSGKELHNIMHRYIIHTTRLNAINDGFLFFKRNDTNGRLDTNLTSLPSYLRPYIISNEKLINLDIKNSQPYFLYALIKDNPTINQDELKMYAELVVSGMLYEFMAKQYSSYTGYSRTRKQMKHLVYKIFFSKNQSFKKQKDFFGKMFPTIMTFINQTNNINNNTLALSLQQLESTTVLDIIMPLLQKEGIIPFTIHDSFVCMESEAERIRTTFIEKLTELFGIAPAMHMDYILPEIEEQEELIDWNEFLEEMNKESKELEQVDSTAIKIFPKYSKEEIHTLIQELVIK